MDVSYLKDMPIAVLGAGAVGKTMAADCAMEGKEVRLWDQPAFAKKNFTNIEKTGITLSGNQFSYFGFQRKGNVKIALATDDLAKAVKGAGIIIVATVAVAHETIFRELIPLLEDGQVIHILPDNCGTFVFRKLMREMGCEKKVVVGAWYTAPYGIRIVRRGGVVTNECKVEDRITTIRGCALPMTDNEAFMASAYYIPAFGAIIDAQGEVTGEFHHGFVEGNTVLDINLSNVNPVIHVPGTVLGVYTMQNFDTVLVHEKKNYSLYGFA
ncbi:MAG: 3-hydroxyacyl-CoA dehydrogenase NAD-binding domain-containing protein, partial [Clostridiales bacterium]|nr:3-hydroxyacyl-CoA dehydrogenase NAD-binding domain-containing protein [Clostridiales bacterium]